LLFNEFRKQRIEFTKTQLKNFLINKCNDAGESHSPNSIDTDIGVLLKTYVKPSTNDSRQSIEDQYSSLLIELDLIKKFTNAGMNENQWYKIESENRENIPNGIFLYAILDNYPEDRSISLHKLLNDENSPGIVFALNPDAVVEKVQAISQQFDGEEKNSFRPILWPELVIHFLLP
jgi:hypothetical protein